MKKRYFVVGLVVVLVLIVAGWFVVRPNNPESNKKTDVLAVQQQVVLLDVRTTEEFNFSHAEGSMHFELEKLQSGEMPNIPKNDNTVIKVYCRSGNRAGEAKMILEKNGFMHVENIGGLDDWQSSGGKVVGNS